MFTTKNSCFFLSESINIEMLNVQLSTFIWGVKREQQTKYLPLHQLNKICSCWCYYTIFNFGAAVCRNINCLSYFSFKYFSDWSSIFLQILDNYADFLLCQFQLSTFLPEYSCKVFPPPVATELAGAGKSPEKIVQFLLLLRERI